MSRYNTGASVPSNQVKDFSDNAQIVDEIVHLQQPSTLDRFGNMIKTWFGIQQDANSAIAAFGYITMDSFQAGNTLTLPNQVLRDTETGEYYRWDGAFPKTVPAGSTPDSAGGVGLGAWLGVGDATARAWVSENFSKSPFALIQRDSFSTGSTISDRNQALLNSDGFYYQYFGALPHTVLPGDSPTGSDWVSVGLQNGYDLSNPLNWGVEYGTTTEQKDKFQFQMDSLSKRGGGTIILDGWIYLAQTINEIVPDPIYVENQANYFFKVPDNITVKSNRGYQAGFKVAPGVVAANQDTPYSKGFQVFCDAGRRVKNFIADGFAIDYNGKNNYLPPLSTSNPQALCPGFWFLQGEDIYIRNILHIECPGQQCVVLDYLVDRCEISKNIFYHCGGTLAGNNNINDHSSIFCLASNYSVNGNIGIGFDGTANTRLSRESTFLECHGQHGRVFDNQCYGYNCGAIFGAIRNDLIDVTHYGNTYYSVGYGINYDGGNNRNFTLKSHSNVIVLRENRPSSGKSNVGHGHGVFQFSSYGFPIMAKLELESWNNTFTQVSVDPDWDGNDAGSNVIFEGGKFTNLSLNDDAHGFLSGFRLNYPSGKTISIKGSLYKCGSNNSVVSFFTSLFQMQNVDSGFNSDNANYMDINVKLDKNCLYTKSYFF